MINIFLIYSLFTLQENRIKNTPEYKQNYTMFKEDTERIISVKSFPVSVFTGMLLTDIVLDDLTVTYSITATKHFYSDDPKGMTKEMWVGVINMGIRDVYCTQPYGNKLPIKVKFILNSLSNSDSDTIIVNAKDVCE